jgi:hypothetical protein
MISACSVDIKMDTYVFVVAKHVYVGVSCFLPLLKRNVDITSRALDAFLE